MLSASESLKTFLLSLLAILFFIPSLISEANAQYFGHNKVQYEDFNFQILETPHFDIYHYPKEEKAIKDLGRLSERWYKRHSKYTRPRV